MIALEAWWMEKPVIVNGRCEIMKEQCRQSNGGLYYQFYEEFEIIIRKLLSNPKLSQQLGRQGHYFVARNYHWDVIMAKYQAILETMF